MHTRLRTLGLVTMVLLGAAACGDGGGQGPDGRSSASPDAVPEPDAGITEPSPEEGLTDPLPGGPDLSGNEPAPGASGSVPGTPPEQDEDPVPDGTPSESASADGEDESAAGEALRVFCELARSYEEDWDAQTEELCAPFLGD
ncbi:hypothetical protein ACL02R_05625 [Streptomyces sp. MS19]|uniref:hypothetical protein n=1 Tax=Streptomyces sp. MS19 TaxID=3385972 RepID=UPI0039A04A0C